MIMLKDNSYSSPQVQNINMPTLNYLSKKIIYVEQHLIKSLVT